ncbi:MAG: 50S ribosomal protein L9 [Silicimonas sp.]|nr:50S ribosomal protein L9 [Silicimonas sp.]NNF91814.1 50S ribosomal protein L9 [Boseongicola sp.]RZW03681.1 MAG: 50S ribosomal protein L9 [Paracoccaceae bacterium]MBT8426378.1 50S ribosomal protein L9 [Silicimonas sp.]NND17663.1 50S ribosomal protein L9 [Silicimonas sp.]
MQVILLERVAKLGQMGDVVNVKDGYARNFLLPQKKALWASDANIKQFETDKAQLEARNLETKQEAEALADRLSGQQFTVIRQASDGGSLYGSVTTRDAADVATEAGFSVDRGQINIASPIKELGVHKVTVTLHPEVEAIIELNVARSEEEAALQAQGIDIVEQAAEEEAAADLEIAELFEDIGAAELDELETVSEQETGEPAVQEKAELDEALEDGDDASESDEKA